MRKFIFIITMFCMTIMSCTKLTDETPQVVTISFTEQFVERHSMTRGTNDFLATIEAQTPEYVNVTLTNTETGKTFTCKSNEDVTVLSGNYNVTAEYTALDYNEPSLASVPVNVDINSETSSVNLDIFYNCYAVFGLSEECFMIYYCRPNTLYEDPFTRHENLLVAFFTDNRTINLIAHKDSDKFVDTTYEFSTTKVDGKVYAEYGKYYVVHPTPNPNTTSSFITNTPSMTEGEL